MRIINTDLIGQKIYELASTAAYRVTSSCANSLKLALEKEENENAKFALNTNLENFEIAKKLNLPVCQDTGMCVIFLFIGQNIFLEGELIGNVIDKYVQKAYENNFLRMSVCDVLTRENTKSNTPSIQHIEIVEGDKLEIIFMPKGFGSENMSRNFMLTPSKGKIGIIESVIETVQKAGSNPCPPVVVGVGIGGSFEKSAYLSKKALTRDIGKFNERKDVELLEKELLERINNLLIGAQGFKGNTTALAVNIEIFETHISALPVSVNIQCHCVRMEKCII